MSEERILKALYPFLHGEAQSPAKLDAALDTGIPDDCVRIAAAHPASADAGPMFGTVRVEKLQVERAA